MSNNDLRRYVNAVQLDLAHLLQLLGGTEEERERYFEIVLGITSRADFILVGEQIKGIQVNLKSAHDSAQALTAAAREILAEG